MDILPESKKGELLTAEETGRYLQINSQKTLYDLFNQNDFPAFKIGNRWRISAKDLDEYLTTKRDQNELKQSA